VNVAAPAGTAWTEERTRAIIAANRHQRGALMPILHALLAEFGYIDQRAIAVLAEQLNLSRAEVYGVVTFYRDFRTTPPAATRMSICLAEACQSVGADGLLAHLRDRYGVAPGQTSADGNITLSEVFCLGNCALGPAIMINETLVGLADPGRIDAVVAAASSALTETTAPGGVTAAISAASVRR
jgi:formate dehydrogenase subunit gamma